MKIIVFKIIFSKIHFDDLANVKLFPIKNFLWIIFGYIKVLFHRYSERYYEKLFYRNCIFLIHFMYILISSLINEFSGLLFDALTADFYARSQYDRHGLFLSAVIWLVRFEAILGWTPADESRFNIRLLSKWLNYGLEFGSKLDGEFNP